jgi:hypothetical protein
LQVTLLFIQKIPRNAHKPNQTEVLELISEFGKITGYKINIHIAKMLVYASNKHMETEIETQPHLKSLKQ